MCGSCQEFAPEVAFVAAKSRALRFGVVYVDQEAGRQLADQYGVLDAGLPAAGLFAAAGGAYTPLVRGDAISRGALLRLLKDVRDLSGWTKDEATGLYQKKAAKGTKGAGRAPETPQREL